MVAIFIQMPSKRSLRRTDGMEELFITEFSIIDITWSEVWSFTKLQWPFELLHWKYLTRFVQVSDFHIYSIVCSSQSPFLVEIRGEITKCQVENLMSKTSFWYSFWLSQGNVQIGIIIYFRFSCAIFRWRTRGRTYLAWKMTPRRSCCYENKGRARFAYKERHLAHFLLNLGWINSKLSTPLRPTPCILHCEQLPWTPYGRTCASE